MVPSYYIMSLTWKLISIWYDCSMEEIYGLLVTIDYPDGLTRGLRRTTDMVRGVLERTRGDFTVAVRQSNLEAELRRTTRI